MKVRYIATCIEAGEHFFFTFISEETDPIKLKRKGMEGAAGWGGECISVEKDADQENLEADK